MEKKRRARSHREREEEHKIGWMKMKRRARHHRKKRKRMRKAEVLIEKELEGMEATELEWRAIQKKKRK